MYPAFLRRTRWIIHLIGYGHWTNVDVVNEFVDSIQYIIVEVINAIVPDYFVTDNSSFMKNFAMS